MVAATLHLRDLLRTAHPELQERVRTGWHSLNYRHPQAGFVCGLFPRDAGVTLVVEFVHQAISLGQRAGPR